MMRRMRLWIARTSVLPVREQLVAQLLLAILSRELGPGDRLPSTRELARRLHVHSNTVSAAYAELERRGWVESRRGSGVFVCQRRTKSSSGPDQILDQLVADFFRAAREQGISLRRVHERLRHWLALQPPDHFAVIEADEDLRQILMAEIEAAVSLPAIGIAPESCGQRGMLSGAIPVVLLSKYDQIRAALPADVDCVALQVRSVPGSLEGWTPIPRDALIVVASRWQGFLQWARTLLLSAGAQPDALELRDTRRPQWRRGLQQARVVIADVVTARNVPRECRTLTFPLVSDASLNELRRYAGIAAVDSDRSI
jgi:DNA-binding transcriptional regulator YhcF (GntR family)